MCGIVGMVAFGGAAIDLGVMRKANDLQSHRGPDGEGFLLVSRTAAGFDHSIKRRLDPFASKPVQVGLGHRRLSIIDLSDRGFQPMKAGSHDCWLVFNGEIYNHLELKDELEGLGHKFGSRTDTEVLLEAYIHWGDDFLERIQGMYAFAIWDGRQGRLLCARDRLGIKPFYYAQSKEGFIFASEIKAILAVPGFDREPDDEAVLGFLAHGNCDFGERTTLKNVRALPAGYTLTLDLAAEKTTIKRYWSLQPGSRNGASDPVKIERLKELLISTTRSHLISDVRAGSCLSGGLDSSTVVSLIGKISREQPEAATAVGNRLFTFTSCYEYKQLDERQYALSVAHSAQAQPHLVFPSAEDFWSDFERMAWHQDMPFGGLSYYAQWRVMRAAKEAGVKVLLDGQGGDEVFGGYAKFRYAYLASLLRSGRLGRMVKELGATVNQRDLAVLDLRRGYRYLPKGLRSMLHVDSMLKGTLNANWNEVVSSTSTPSSRWWRNAASNGNGHDATAMQRIQIDDLLVDTLPQLLRFEDRSSMAFSIEARVPLLDHKVVEYGLSLPDHLKIQNGWSKYAVRRAMQGMIPESVRMRKTKLGFAAPDRIWPQQNLRDQINDLIGGTLRCAKYVNPGPLRRWFNSEAAKTANAESYLGLFRVLSLEMWMRSFQVS